MGAKSRPHAVTITQLSTKTSKIFVLLGSHEDIDDGPTLLTKFNDCIVTALGIVSSPLSAPLLTGGVDVVAFISCSASAVLDAMARLQAVQMIMYTTSCNWICGADTRFTTPASYNNILVRSNL